MEKDPMRIFKLLGSLVLVTMAVVALLTGAKQHYRSHDYREAAQLRYEAAKENFFDYDNSYQLTRYHLGNEFYDLNLDSADQTGFLQSVPLFRSVEAVKMVVRRNQTKTGYDIEFATPPEAGPFTVKFAADPDQLADPKMRLKFPVHSIDGDAILKVKESAILAVSGKDSTGAKKTDIKNLQLTLFDKGACLMLTYTLENQQVILYFEDDGTH